MKNLKFVLFVLVCIIIFSCKKEDDNNTNPDPVIKLAPNTVWIDIETAQKIESVDSVKIIYNGNTTQLENLKVGDIIVSSIAPNAPNGFLRKITNIQKSKGEYEFTTIEVPLTEAFEELDVDYTKSYTATDTGAKRTNGLEFNIPFPNVLIYDADGNGGTTYDQIRLNGSLKITPELTVKIKIKGRKLLSAKIGGSFTKVLDRTIVAGGSLIGFDKEITVYEQPLSAFLIPWTPIVVIPTLSVSIGANGSISVQISYTESETSTSGAYIEYADGSWNTSSVKTMTNQSDFTGYIGNINAKAYIRPAINFKFWGSDWAKGSFFIDAYAELNAQLLPYQPCELKVGLSGGAEANLSFFDYEFLQASYPDIFDFSKVIYSCASNLAPVADFSASETNITVGTSINFTDLSTESPTSWAWSFEGGSPSTSNAQNPTNIQYNTAGTYNVSLSATNANGTNTKTKTVYIIVTTSNPLLPTLTTTSATSITQTTATSGGNITSDGGSAVTARGVCWSTSQNPLVTGNHTSDGTGTGAFTSNIIGLTANTLYYVRAYATNSAGTAYGNEISFTTTSTIINITYLQIPAGTFTMGSPTTEVNHSSDETQYQVTLSAFRMSKYEITNAQYAAFLNAKSIGSNGLYASGAYPTQALIYVSSGSYDWGLHYTGGQWVPVAGYENHPIIKVTWYGATEFATYVGGSLPTESQWEYACRGNTSTPFNTGNCLNDAQANYDWSYPYSTCTNTNTTRPWTTQAVGSYTANAYGLYDMHGNVWEWCSDWYGTYPTTAQNNPTGATNGSYRVFRGGSWNYYAQYCRSAYRSYSNPYYSSPSVGFRVALVP